MSEWVNDNISCSAVVYTAVPFASAPEQVATTGTPRSICHDVEANVNVKERALDSEARVMTADVNDSRLTVAWVTVVLLAIVYLLTNPLLLTALESMYRWMYTLNVTAEIPYQVAVPMLSRENFQQHINDRFDHHHIILYLHRDANSEALRSNWLLFAEIMKIDYSIVDVAMVDCTDQSLLCRDLEVAEFPTIRWYMAYSFEMHEYQTDVERNTKLASYYLFAKSMLQLASNTMTNRNSYHGRGEVDDFMFRLYDHDQDDNVKEGQNFDDDVAIEEFWRGDISFGYSRKERVDDIIEAFAIDDFYNFEDDDYSTYNHNDDTSSTDVLREQGEGTTIPYGPTISIKTPSGETSTE